MSDGINDATYNIAVWENNFYPKDMRDLNVHLNNSEGDVKLWIKYGVKSNDKLTKDQRKVLWNKSRDIYFNGTDEEIEIRKESGNQYLPIYSNNMYNYWNNKGVFGGDN